MDHQLTTYKNAHTKNKQRGNVFVILLIGAALLAGLGIYSSHQKELRQIAAQKAISEEMALAQKKKQDEERAALEERLAQEKQQKDVLTVSIKAINAAHARWVDAVKIAESTSRVSLSGPVTTLQNIRRETQELTVAPCMDDAKATLLSSMDTTIEGFLTFMTNKGEIGNIVAGGILSKGAEQLSTFTEQREQCSQ